MTHIAFSVKVLLRFQYYVLVTKGYIFEVIYGDVNIKDIGNTKGLKKDGV